MTSATSTGWISRSHRIRHDFANRWSPYYFNLCNHPFFISSSSHTKAKKCAIANLSQSWPAVSSIQRNTWTIITNIGTSSFPRFVYKPQPMPVCLAALRVLALPPIGSSLMPRACRLVTPSPYPRRISVHPKPFSRKR